MSKKIDIMDVEIDNCTAKEAMKKAVGYLETEPVSLIEMITSDILLQLDAVPELKERLGGFDLLMAGETTLLEACGVTEKKILQETQNRTFLKMFMRYLHKNHKRVYLLAETEEEMTDFEEFVHKFYNGIQVVGISKVTKENRTDDMIVNAVNCGEADCVLSILSSPLQEEFTIKNRCLLNTRIYINLGKEIIPVCRKKMKQNWFTQFVVKRILKNEIEKRKKNGGN